MTSIEFCRTATNDQLSRRGSSLSYGESFSHYMQQAAVGFDAASPAVHWENFKKLHEFVKLELVPLPVDDFVSQLTVKPTEADLQKLYDKHKESARNPNTPEPGFRRLPKADFAYLKMDFNTLLEAEKKKITEAEIKAPYDEGVKKGEYTRTKLPPAAPPTQAPPPAGAPGTESTPPATTPDNTPSTEPTPPATPATDDTTKQPGAPEDVAPENKANPPTPESPPPAEPQPPAEPKVGAPEGSNTPATDNPSGDAPSHRTAAAVWCKTRLRKTRRQHLPLRHQRHLPLRHL